jgi:hypothetical protein
MPIETSVGFTGTRDGYNAEQSVKFSRLMRKFVGEFNDGWAVGADEQAARFVDRVGGFVIHAHPPTNPKYRSDFKPRSAQIVWHEEKEYVERDLDIVVASEVMIATPRQFTEIRRGSGTWLTIRLSRAETKPLAIIHKDGSIIYERWPKSLPKV